ncbi:MAG: adenine phosphoribosyltransferase [Gemmatimonadetes bacterium]|nr:adenine phosphoribosyltransferase [Gemmatimonadota bacterium]
MIERIRSRIRDIPDFPQPGIMFKDITPLLSDARLFPEVVEGLAAEFAEQSIEQVVGIESRGFIFAAPLALELGCGFVPVRKPGKLPFRTLRVDYELEYGSDALEAHVDAIRPGQRVLIVDDVLATGGTAAATARLVSKLGGQIVAAAFIVELAFLGGRGRLAGVPVHSVLRYDSG